MHTYIYIGTHTYTQVHTHSGTLFGARKVLEVYRDKRLVTSHCGSGSVEMKKESPVETALDGGAQGATLPDNSGTWVPRGRGSLSL